MRATAAHRDATLERQPFPSWSIVVPAAFEEAFVVEVDAEQAYWHAYDVDRSVSLTSMVITDRSRPVPARAIVDQMPPLGGKATEPPPPGILGWGVTGPATQPARASRALSGLLAVSGKALIVTITANDLDWARSTWRSIRTHAPSAGVHH
jgi:hypothetical protein